ncbi:hypothetical protein AOXY_G17985 [Acipenser oxyrinchus oxyrinchus]|uniref:Uncharacterized protein n=1 Tax=Acipenser oxyrinchus oxyrinchus TaxID=40147 RepID=A0AAD8D497_ACIOX|nr:hypothetical protein AOXY_G17985 [Acipenser oxyrinchus oxyrinchus]
MEEAPQGTFQDELDWCIQQLENGSLTLNPRPHAEETQRVLNLLQSRRATFVRKRQLMQKVFGDYRQKMAEEHKQQKGEAPLGEAVSGSFSMSREQRAKEGWGFTPSDNSFAFNFFPGSTGEDGSEPGSGAPEESAETHPAPVSPGTLSFNPQEPQSADFAFNFQIPSEEAEGQETAPQGALPDPGKGSSVNPQVESQGGETKPSKKKKKKKASNKKHEADETDVNKKQRMESQGKEASRSEQPALSSEQQLSRELDWCIEQLELGLKTQKSTPKQVEEAVRAVRTLRSSKAPLAKKRQVMRTMLGDYRKKMEAERLNQVKLMQTASKSARVSAVTKLPKSQVLHKRGSLKAQEGPEGPEEPGCSEASGDGAQGSSTERFTFTPAQEEFRFNFF